MLLLLPAVFFTLIFLTRLRSGDPQGGEAPRDWRTSWIEAAVLMAAGIALVTELLGALRMLRPVPVGVSWIVATAGLGFFAYRQGAIPALRLAPWRLWRQRVSLVLLLEVASLALVAFVVLIVALKSQPNGIDSLLYHLPRMEHWIQNGSLAPYATQYWAQAWIPPFASEAMLHLRLLSGSESAASLVQWFSAISAAITASAIAHRLGGNVTSQWLAAVYFATMPIVVLQASGTLSDVLASFWLLAIAYFVTLGAIRRLTARETLGLGLAIGMGLLSKATLYLLSAPFLLWFGIATWRRRPGATELAKVVAWLAVPIVVLNAPYWIRNISSSGGPFGPRHLVGAYTVEGNAVAALTALPANLVRAGLLHMASPSQTLNEQLSAWGRSLGGVSEAVGTEYYLIWRWNHENFATAPIQLGLALLSIPVVVFAARRRSRPVLTGYLLVAVSLPLAVVPWFATAALPNSGVRYQMPIFAVWAPLVGIAVVAMFRTRGAMLGWALIALSIPWVLFNWSRPLIGMRPHPEGLEVGCHPLLGCTGVGSVLETPAVEIVFAESPGLQGAYRRAALAVREGGCTDVGLRLDSHDPEYPIWWLLSSGSEPTIRIESLYSLPELERFQDPDFRPCAIICTICGARETLHGLRLVYEEKGIKVYGGEGYRSDPDAPVGK